MAFTPTYSASIRWAYSPSVDDKILSILRSLDPNGVTSYWNFHDRVKNKGYEAIDGHFYQYTPEQLSTMMIGGRAMSELQFSSKIVGGTQVKQALMPFQSGNYLNIRNNSSMNQKSDYEYRKHAKEERELIRPPKSKQLPLGVNDKGEFFVDQKKLRDFYAGRHTPRSLQPIFTIVFKDSKTASDFAAWCLRLSSVQKLGRRVKAIRSVVYVHDASEDDQGRIMDEAERRGGDVSQVGDYEY